MENRIEERLPQVVEDRLQEAYHEIRERKAKQMTGKGKKKWIQRYSGIAAACAILVVGSLGALAATTYFQKEVHQEAGEVTYQFSLNYELIPGEYKITPSYLPEGYTDQKDGKYNRGEDDWITIMPIYTTAELDKLDGKLAMERVEKVEHTTLSGMEADIITYQEAQKYKADQDIYLFHPTEGCVIQIVASYSVPTEELLKFADSLSVERIGDTAFETEEEKQEREQEEAEEEQQNAHAKDTLTELVAAGIPEDKIFSVGEEVKYWGAGYTVTGYEYLDSIEGFSEENFFDFSRFDGWLNEDKTLKSYQRQYYDRDGQLIAEDTAEQEILKVDIKVHCYEKNDLMEVPLDFQRVPVEKISDQKLTWDLAFYQALPEENNYLQMDNSAAYLEGASHTEGEDRKQYFFKEMENGEEWTYTLLFVVDKDQRGQFVLTSCGANASFEQTPTMSAEEILSELEGYIYLE